MPNKPDDRGSSRKVRGKRERDADTRQRQLRENAKKHTEERLDEGIEETFPASDPVAVRITK